MFWFRKECIRRSFVHEYRYFGKQGDHMKKIDTERWERRELYDFFSGMSQPFYSVTFQVDVTELYQYVKQKGLSFYHALVWLCTKAANRVENFVIPSERRTCGFWMSGFPVLQN